MYIMNAKTMLEPCELWEGYIRKSGMGFLPHRQGWVKDTVLYSRPALGLGRVVSEMLMYKL